MLKNKRKNVKTFVDWIKFDSKLEARFYNYIKNHPKINLLELQTPFVLQEWFKYNNKKIRPITYKADFKIEVEGDIYFIDSKGKEEPIFKIKKKMWLKKFGGDNNLLVCKSIKQLGSFIF